jgi:hypothetical protein
MKKLNDLVLYYHEYMKTEKLSSEPVTANSVNTVLCPRIYLAILNITSWAGSIGATHVYGHLILSTKEKVTIDNIDEHNVHYLGETIEIKRPLTPELAEALDKKDGGNSYKRALRWMQEDSDFAKENPEQGMTERFDTLEEVVNAGIAKWKELNINCPFISLYKNKKYKANSYESSSTVVLQYGA